MMQYVVYFFMLCISTEAFSSNIERYFQSIQSNPKALQSFFTAMPKGGELHYHFDGSTPAPTMLQLAKTGPYCLDSNTQTIYRTKAACHGLSIQKLLDSPAQYNQVVQEWSMEHYTPGSEKGLAHFFSIFGKEATLQSDYSPQLLAKIIQRAATQHELYLEIIAFHLTQDAQFAKKLQSLAHLTDKKRILLTNRSFQNHIQHIEKDSFLLLKQARQKLGCNSKPHQAACAVNVKFQYYIYRNVPLDQVFAQALAGFVVAAQSNNIVGVNLVGDEHGELALKDYAPQMKIFEYLHSVYPTVHIALHAGELSDSLVPSKDLNFHIHDAVFVGQAERIGHGVDIRHENHLHQLIKKMAKKPVAVEINLTSNQQLLAITGKQHPLGFYLKHHIPTILSTDDEGILRTDLTQQYVEATTVYKLNYPTIKAMNRNTLTYAFLPGKSLWADTKHTSYVPACHHLESPACQQFLKQNLKARLQLQLEKQLEFFEKSVLDQDEYTSCRA